MKLEWWFTHLGDLFVASCMAVAIGVWCWMNLSRIIALALSGIAMWLGTPPTQQHWIILALLGLSAAVAHRFPVKSSTQASYRLTNVFLVAGAIAGKEITLKRVDASHLRVLDMAAAATDEELGRHGRHPRGIPYTVRDVLLRHLAHDLAHFEQIEAIRTGL